MPALADGQAWFSAETKGRIADGLLLMADANIRMTDAASHPGHMQVRGFLGHQMGKVTMAGGYAWVRASKAGGAVRHEHRLTQQIEVPLIETPDMKLVARTRLEQRFYSDRGGVSWQLREKLKLTLPVGQEGFALVTHGELFAALNGGPSGAKGGDVQSRIFGGFLIPFTRAVSLEAGYLNQHDWQRAKATSHVLSLSLGTRF